MDAIDTKRLPLRARIQVLEPKKLRGPHSQFVKGYRRALSDVLEIVDNVEDLVMAAFDTNEPLHVRQIIEKTYDLEYIDVVVTCRSLVDSGRLERGPGQQRFQLPEADRFEEPVSQD